MVSKRYSRKKKGGNKWNCSCTPTWSPSTKKIVTVPASRDKNLKSALAIQSAAMSPDQKGMKALMAKPGMTEAKAKAILSRQSKKKVIAQKIQSRNVGTSTTGAKKQAKKTLRKATKAQKKKPSRGGKRKTRRLRSKRGLRSKRR